MQKYAILLFLLLLPTVSASSFTGSVSDDVIDTDGDNLFNYLVIEVEVNIINTNVEYDIAGTLEDIGTYDSGCGSLSYGKQNILLYFDGSEIYRKKLNGPYKLSNIELFAGTCGSGMDEPDLDVIDSLLNIYTKYYDYTEFQKGKPAINCYNSPCIADSSLISSRDNLDTAEPNAPNTIDGCEDGTEGKYRQHESIESINVTSLNNNFFKIGDPVKVEVEVYCSSFYNYDKLNFVYTNNINDINWAVKDQKQCPLTGIQKLSTTFNLDNNVGNHSIRGVYSLSLKPNTTCGRDASQKNWADTDDVVIYVKECNSNNDCNNLDTDCADGICNLQTYQCTQVFKPATTQCRASTGVCDIEEKCTGSSKHCPADSYKPKGTDCGICAACDDLGDCVDNDDPECLGKYQIALTQGWNLISLPKIDNNNINEIIKLFNNNLEKIVALKNNNWYIYDKLNLANSNLNELSEENGFWVKVNNNISVLIENESAAYTSFQLAKGWNLIGYPSLEEKDVNELFQNVMDDIELIYVYNNKFSSFNPQNPSTLIIKPGMGIFVKIKNDVQWYFDGEVIECNKSVKLDRVTFDGYTLNEDSVLNTTRGDHLVEMEVTAYGSFRNVELSLEVIGYALDTRIENHTDDFDMNSDTTYIKQLTLSFPLNMTSDTYSLKVIGIDTYGFLFIKNYPLWIIEQCSDNLDNDNDGLIDEEDPGCWNTDGSYNRSLDDESISTQLTTFNISLSQGWNLISIPLTSNKTTSEIFGSNKLYYLENNKWKQLENNDKINYSYGYWIKANESSLIIEGNIINNLSFNINQGWNLINYPLDKETAINIFFQNVTSNIESIASFEDGEWQTYSPSKPDELNSLNTLKPGKGIFIKAKSSVQWHFDGNELVAT